MEKPPCLEAQLLNHLDPQHLFYTINDSNQSVKICPQTAKAKHTVITLSSILSDQLIDMPFRL
jgi:hypothetical protein